MQLLLVIQLLGLFYIMNLLKVTLIEFILFYLLLYFSIGNSNKNYISNLLYSFLINKKKI